MGNEASKQTFLGQKYIVTDHALRVGFRNKPDLEAYFLANKKDKNSKISIEQGELVTLKPGSKVIGQDGTEFIQILEPEWDWEGKTYRVKGKYLPLTNPKYGVCLEEYDGKPKLEMFQDDAGFETVAKDVDFNDDAIALQKAALDIAKDVETMDMGDAKQEFKGEATSEILKKQTAYVAFRNSEAQQVSKKVFSEPKMAEKLLETLDNDIGENPEWKYARNLYAQDKWATLDYHQEDSQAFAFDENEADCSNRSVVAVLSGIYKSTTEIVVEAESKIDTGGEYASNASSLVAGVFVSGKGIEGDSKIKSINRKNASEFKIVLTENAKEADFVFTLISKKENVTFTFEQEYVKDEGWDRPPIEITEKEALANKQRFDEDVAKNQTKVRK
eukprot:g3266.t1